MNRWKHDRLCKVVNGNPQNTAKATELLTTLKRTQHRTPKCDAIPIYTVQYRIHTYVLYTQELLRRDRAGGQGGGGQELLPPEC